MKFRASGKFFHWGRNSRPGIHRIGSRKALPLVLSDVVSMKAIGNSMASEPSTMSSVQNPDQSKLRTLSRARLSRRLRWVSLRWIVASTLLPLARSFVVDPEVGCFEGPQRQKQHGNEEDPRERIGIAHVADVGEGV